ncbi:MAG: nuclear transport factor 2 family protein [Sphingobacteriaceae bacterium]|nr:nuclear transport factor 2 family protein [Sphingobacteriaceae bacterium]
MKNIFTFLFILSFNASFAFLSKKDSLEIKKINLMLDAFNTSAANAEYEKYFDFFDEDAIFIGTDATENWNKQKFKVWAKPYFDRKKTWNFKAIERNIYFDKSGNFAWFDELLNTQMKICRGSGVLIKKGNEWKLKQYVLSMTIPNSKVDSVVRIKSPIEIEIIKNLSSKK